MDQNPHPQTFYLHYNFQNFWEITIDPSSNSTKERFGNMNHENQEDLNSIQTNILFHNSWQEVLNTAHILRTQKTSEGYCSLPKLNPNPLTTKSNEPINEEKTNYSSKNLKRKPKEDLVREDQKMVKKSNNLPPEESSKGLGAKVADFFKNLFSFHSQDNVKIELPISTRVYRQAALVEKKSRDLNLTCKIYEEAVVMEGDARKVDLFEYFLRDLAQENAQKEIELPNLSREVSDLILKKAKLLNVYCEFFEERVIMRGSQEGLDGLSEYISTLETTPQDSTPILTEDGKIQTMIKSHNLSEPNVKKVVHGVKKQAEISDNTTTSIKVEKSKKQIERELLELERKREKYIHLSKKILEFYTPIGFFLPP